MRDASYQLNFLQHRSLPTFGLRSFSEAIGSTVLIHIYMHNEFQLLPVSTSWRSPACNTKDVTTLTLKIEQCDAKTGWFKKKTACIHLFLCEQFAKMYKTVCLQCMIMLSIHVIVLIMCIPYNCLQLHVNLYCSDWLKFCDIVDLSFVVSSVYINKPVALLSLFVLAIKRWSPCWYLTVSSLTNCNVELKMLLAPMPCKDSFMQHPFLLWQ